jgi:hypothetical protein
MGVFPTFFLKPMEPAVQKLVQRAQSVQTLQVQNIERERERERVERARFERTEGPERSER